MLKIYKVDYKVLKISPSLESSQAGSNNHSRFFDIVLLVDQRDTMARGIFSARASLRQRDWLMTSSSLIRSL